MAAVDVGRLDADSSATDTGAATSDTGQHGAGFFDTLLDVVRDVIGDVVDAEVRDARAGGDAGADAGTACVCLPPPATYTFSGTAAGLPIFGPSSMARIDVRALPPSMGPFGKPVPVVQLTVEFTAWVSRTRGPAAPLASGAKIAAAEGELDAVSNVESFPIKRDLSLHRESSRAIGRHRE